MAGATAVVTYGGVDITNKVLFETASFTTNSNGAPGQFEFRVKDPTNTLNLVTGKEVTLSLNGTTVFGGYCLSLSRTFAFPDKTDGVRQWVVRGVDYNILFDKRVLRNTSDYLHQLPNPSPTVMDGTAIKNAITNYSDLTGFDLSTIEDVEYYNHDGTSKSAYPQQGSTLRELIDGPAFRAGCVYYIAADKKVHYRGLETATSLWGFSDSPNETTTYKMHDLDIVEDGSVIVNDALVWGGSQWAGTGGTVFYRAQSSSSQTTYGRWQQVETHFGEEGYGIQAGVQARATSIVSGPTGADALNQLKGLRYPQWQMSFSWWLHDIPSLPIPGTIYTITSSAFGLTKVLPLRSMTMTFPELDENGDAYVLMRGEFSLNVTDPYTLWEYVRRNNKRIITAVVSSVNDSSTSTIYGAYGAFTSPTNVSGLIYDLPFGYIPSTLMVYDGGLALTPGTGFTETNHATGRFTLADTPTGALYVTCRTLSA